MTYRFQFWMAILAVTGWWLAGCSSFSSPPRAVPNAPSAKVKRAIPTSEPAREDEKIPIESLAHFAAGFSHDLNGEPDLALEEYRQAALNNPAYEPLIIEVTRRYLRQKKPEKAVELLAKVTSEKTASGTLYAWLGLAYGQMGKAEQAITANRAAIKKMPRSLAAYQNLAQLYLQNNKTNEAVQVLDEAGRLPSPDAAFLIDLAELYARSGRLGALTSDKVKVRVKELLGRAVTQNPTNPAVLQKLADGFLQIEELAKAEELYLQLLKISPEMPVVRGKLADLYLRSGRKEKATEQLEAIAKEDPVNPLTQAFLGALAVEQKKFPEAARHYERALLLNPNLEQTYYDLADVKINLEKEEEALAVLEKARARFKPSFQMEYTSGVAHMRLKHYPEAIKYYISAELEAKANEPERLNHALYFNLGAACERNRQPKDAEKYFQKALARLDEARAKFKPSFGTEYYSGIAHMHLKQYAEAIKYFVSAEREAKANEPERLDRDFYFELGAACERNGQHQDAEKYFQKCLELSPNDPGAMNYLGYMWTELGIKLDQAQRLIEKAVEAEPKNSAYLDSLGWVLFKLNRPREGLPWLLQAVENSDESEADIYDHLGDVYSALKEFDRAREAWRKSLNAEANDKIQRKLEATPVSGPSNP